MLQFQILKLGTIKKTPKWDVLRKVTFLLMDTVVPISTLKRILSTHIKKYYKNIW